MYLTEQQRKMIEATLFNLVYYDDSFLNRSAFKKYVGSLTDQELEQEVNEYLHGVRRIARTA